MSATYTQWCKQHGEWNMDIDNPSECPKCIELGMTDYQRLQRENAELRERIVALDFEVAGLKSPQPGVEQNLQFQFEAYREELTNLKEAFARLRKDRDRLQQRLVEFGVD